MLSDPERATTFKENNRAYSANYRKNADEQKKEKMREQARLRMAKMRERKKLEAMEMPVQVTTRKQTENHEKLKEQWREQKKKYRESLTPSKRAWINKKRREKRATEKAKAASPAIPQKESVMDTGHSEDNRSDVARRKALSRARQALPSKPEHFATTLHDLREKASPKKKAAMAGGEISPVINQALDHLKVKKDLKSTQQRRILLDIFAKYGTISKRSRVLKMSRSTIKKHSNPNEKQPNKWEETKQNISAFFDVHATPLPDKKLVSKKTGQAQSVLAVPLRVAHQQYKEAGGTAAFSTFAKCRPRHVRKQAATNFNQCLCEYCANVDLKSKAINKLVGIHNKIKHTYHAVALTTCNSPGKDCAYRQCGDCGVGALNHHLEELEDVPHTKWYRWTTKKVKTGNKEVSRKVLETRQGSGHELKEEFMTEVSFLSEHLFRANWQHRQFENIRTSRPFPQGIVMMVLDFAENYTCLQQHEVQSAHWHHDQVTIHPVSTYYACTCGDMIYESIIFLSDDRTHDFHAVHSFVSKTI